MSWAQHRAGRSATRFTIPFAAPFVTEQDLEPGPLAGPGAIRYGQGMEILSVALEGASNVRDLGGYTGRDGRIVRSGRIFRSAALATLTAADLQTMALIARLLAGDTPLLFHCSAGKDRTGFGAALVLTALGVAWEDVVADFEATNRLWRRDTVHSADLPETIRNSLLRAEPALLEAAFAAAEREHGSMNAYFEQALDLDAASRTRLCDALLEDRV
jgi:protein tyrosine/serine phosphatase